MTGTHRDETSPEPVAPARMVRELRRWAAVTVAAEGLACAAYGVYLGVETVVAPATDRVAAFFLAVSALALGAGLVVAARFVVLGRRGARAPVLTWQILQVAIAVPAVPSLPVMGIVLIAMALFTSAVMVWPGVLPVER